jgi:putative restriction endonuclease
MALSLTVQSRLEKAAVDNGFDLQREPNQDWLSFHSSHCNLQIWLTQVELGLILALSHADIANQLAGELVQPSLPVGAADGLLAQSFDALGALVRRAFQLARTLPNALAIEHVSATAGLPRGTEVERLVVQRIGQDIFRRGLLDFWDAKCALTGLNVLELLRASHIKPWAQCDSDAERLNVYNGLLLAPHLDALFDRGLISFADQGSMLISPKLSIESRQLLVLSEGIKLRSVSDAHTVFLAWHRQFLWRK